MSSIRTAFLKKLDSGWQPPPLPPAEELRRHREIIQALLDRVVSADPYWGEMLEFATRNPQHPRAEEFAEKAIAELGRKAEESFPGICAMLDRWVQKEADLVLQVPGTAPGPTGGAS